MLTLPPLLLEKYLKAAEEITQQAIQTPPPLEVYERSWGGTQLKADKGGNANGGTFVLASAGTAVIEDRMPFAGNYTLTVTASGDQAGPDPCEMMIVVGDKELDKIKVPNKDEKDYVVQLKLPAGPRKIGIRFTNDFYKAAEGGNKAQDRNLRIHYVKLEGAHRQAAVLDGRKAPPTHDKLLFVKPTDKISADQATRQVIERFASRAFRRPAKPDEVERLMKLAQSVREADGSFEEGVQVAMQAVLVTPSFLYKIENPPVKPGVMAVPLTDYELATRLSYFLWNSMPDDALLLDAWKGRLKDPQVLESHVQRMLRDVRSNAFIENFGGQWLQLRSLERVSPDPKLFPKFTDSIRSSLKKETLYFVTAVLREDLPVTAMLDGEFTFLNQELAEYYGINGVTGKEFRPVSLKGTGRGGLLTQGSILIVTSNPSRTSPVKRGKWILDNLLGTPPPPAPPDVPQLEKVKLTGTLREQMEQHRVNPACASCHKLMDPLGFALEHFDAVGRVRTQDRGAAIDASGELPDGTKFTGVVQLRQILARERLDLFVRCLSEKMLTYALGRGLEYYDKCAIDEIVRKAEADKLRMSTLITAIVLSEPFRKQGARE